jgi:Tfp pilus assembly protein PilN
MTVDIPTRVPEQQAPDGGRRGLKGGPQITFGRAPRNVGKAPLVVGGQPRANLLPPEIVLKRKQLKTRRGLRFGVVVVAIVTGVACVSTFGVSSVAQVALSSTQQQQQALVLEQAKYAEVSNVQLTIETIKAGEQVGASTEINWRDFINTLQKALPSGVVLELFKVDAATPMATVVQSDAPLLTGARVGTITLTAYSKTLPSIPDWLRSLEKVPGYVDAIPGSVKQEGAGYTAEVTMHFNELAFSNRFDPEHVAAAEAAEAAGHKSDGTVKSMTPAATDGASTDDSTTDGEGN